MYESKGDFFFSISTLYSDQGTITVQTTERRRKGLAFDGEHEAPKKNQIKYWESNLNQPR